MVDGLAWNGSSFEYAEPEEGSRNDAVNDVNHAEGHRRIAVGAHPDDHPHLEHHPTDHEDETETDCDGGGPEIETDQRDTDSEDRPGDGALEQVKYHAGHHVLLRFTSRERRHECGGRWRFAPYPRMTMVMTIIARIPPVRPAITDAIGSLLSDGLSVLHHDVVVERRYTTGGHPRRMGPPPAPENHR